MEEANLESLIKDLYNHARQGLSDDLVAALLETAKRLPTTNEQLLAVRLSGLVTRELLTNPKHPPLNSTATSSTANRVTSAVSGAAWKLV